jgi:hypothetical protein
MLFAVTKDYQLTTQDLTFFSPGYRVKAARLQLGIATILRIFAPCLHQKAGF